MRKKLLVGFVAVTMVWAVFFSLEAQEKSIIDNSKDLFKEIQIFADSLTIISTDYVEPIKVKELVYGAIRGMMDTLDGYSQFLDPDSFKEITEETKGEFAGLGVEIGIRDGILTVISPIADTPADIAGVEAGDKIVKIDDKVTRDFTLDEAVKMMRGAPGTEVSLTVIREGVDEPLEFAITRAIIKLKSIKDSMILEEDIGYVRLVEFQERTARDMRSAVKELRGEGARYLIVDLRNNPGGLLDAAVETSDLFLEPGELIVYTEGRDPTKRMDFLSKKKPEFEDMDMIILVNKGSASAAEILAGALKDNKRAVIVGTTTFGKGSVQTVIPLKDQSALRLTTAAYYTPSGKNLRDKGIEPDVYVKRIKAAARTEEEAAEDKKAADRSKVFNKIEGGPGDKKDADSGKAEDGPERLQDTDNQIQAAVNIFKGVQIFKQCGSVETEKED